MPELPEIETLVRGLRKQVVGKTIAEVHVGQPKALNMPVDLFKQEILGKVEGVDRHGKSAILHLPNGDLWLHMGLGGRIQYLPAALWPAGGFLAFRFAEDGQLALNNVFMGRAHLFPRGKPPGESMLGIDALDSKLTEQRFGELLRAKPKVAVKAALMEQSVIAGIGNSYSDEILVRAGLHPEKRVAGLSEHEISKLHRAMREVLSEAVTAGGESDWHDLNGNAGRYEFAVHGAARCGQCGGPVEKLTSGSRTAYFCPRCQPKDG